MATHSSILAWKSPWTEEPGGLQSMGLHDEHVCTRVEGDGLVAIKWQKLKKKKKLNEQIMVVATFQVS